MTVDSKGRPVIVLLGPGPGGPFPVRVLRFDDGQWLQLGTLDGRADDAAIARDQDRLVLAWSELSRLRVMTWDGTKWTALGDPAGRGRWGKPALVVGR